MHSSCTLRFCRQLHTQRAKPAHTSSSFSTCSGRPKESSYSVFCRRHIAISASCHTWQLELGTIITSSLRRVYFRLSNFLLQRQAARRFRWQHSQSNKQNHAMVTVSDRNEPFLRSNCTQARKFDQSTLCHCSWCQLQVGWGAKLTRRFRSILRREMELTCKNWPMRPSTRSRHCCTAAMSRNVARATANLFSSPAKSSTPPRYLQQRLLNQHNLRWTSGADSAARTAAHSSRSAIGMSSVVASLPC